jgi:hypothetical protein
VSAPRWRPDEGAPEAAVRTVLRRARRRWFAREGTRALAGLALAAAAALGAAGLVARLLAPPPEVLAVLGGAALAVVAAIIVWRVRPLLRLPADDRVARFVEERCPELQDALATATACLGGRPAGDLAAFVVADAARRVADLDPDRIVARRDLVRGAAAAAAALACLAVVAVLVRGPMADVFEYARFALFRPEVAFEVTPGDVRIRQGDTVTLRAVVRGLPERLALRGASVRFEFASGASERDVRAAGDRLEVTVERAAESFSYRFAALGGVSPTYRVTVVPRPRVARIDVHYQYPAFTRLAPRVDEDAGDVYAPAGTKVRLVVHTTSPVAKGSLGFATAGTLPMIAVEPRRLESTFTVARDDAYRVALVEADGVATPDETEYFVRTMDDRPPDVRILRPASDRRVTRLEEVVIEARADDDFGVERFELVYAARGRAERVVPLGRGLPAATVSGRYTLFVEDLDVQPGDFVTYYARARDVARGKRPTEARSDIFFLEIRPFNEEFEAAESQAMMGAAGGSFDDLAARQKELIIATWKLERRATAGRSADDVRALARAQGEIKARAEALAGRIAPPAVDRRRRSTPVPQPPAQADDPMRRAVDAMGRSQAALESLQTAAAIPHEMTALNELLRAQAEIRRRQVARQQSARGGGGGATGNQDLSALFDRELQRQQQTNYEQRGSAEAGERASRSDALDRLRELARRQDDLARRQQELARRRGQLQAEEVRRQLERLTREQQELQRQAEQIAREMQQGVPADASGRAGQQGAEGREVAEAAQAMREAAELGREDPERAGSRGQHAAERLREAARAMADAQPDAAARAAGDLQLEASQIAEAERRLARALRGSGQPAPAADALRQMAGEQARLAQRAARLEASARTLAGQVPPREGTAAGGAAAARREAARSLLEAQIERRLQESAGELRRLGTGATPRPDERDRAAEQMERVARSLEASARALASAAESDRERTRLSEQMARAGEVRDRLEALARQLQDAGRRGSRESPSSDRQPGGQRENGRGQPARGQQGAQGEQGQQGQGQTGRASAAQADGRGRDGRAGGGRGGDGTPETAAEEVAREFRALERLAEGLGEDGEAIRQALASLEGSAPSRSAPGTEAFKQDYARWDILKQGVALALERLEATLSTRLRELADRHRLDAGGDDQAPEQYRSQVARYYRSIARKESQRE